MDFTRYEIPPAAVPYSRRKELNQVHRRLTHLMDGDYRLELHLGPRWSEDRPYVYRTGSRYRLLGAQDQLFATAESILAEADLVPDASVSICVVSDSIGRSFFIAEEQSWATQRYILLEAEAATKQGDGNQASRVTYFEMPERLVPYHRINGVSGGEIEDPPEVLALENRHVFLKQHGRCFRVPVDVLRVKSQLGYTIG